MATKEKPKTPPKPAPATEAKPKTEPKPDPKVQHEAKSDAKKGKSDTSVASSNVSQNTSRVRSTSSFSGKSDTDIEGTSETDKEPECKHPFCHCNENPSNLTKIGYIINGPKYRCGCGVPAVCNDDSIDVNPSQDNLCPNDKPDNRLQTWSNEISLRSCIAKKLMERTGKCCHELLFNRPATVNERDKKMVQRMLAHADRMDPQTRRTYRRQSFNRCTDGVCEYLLLAAMPIHDKHIEISGLSAMTKEEVLGENYIAKGSQWMQSKVLAQQLKTKNRAIKRVLKFFPDIDNLFVVGTAATIHKPLPPPRPHKPTRKGATKRKNDLAIPTSEYADSTDTEVRVLNTCDKIKILASCMRRSQLNNSRAGSDQSIREGKSNSKNGNRSPRKMRQPRAVNISNGTKKTTFA